MYFIFGFVVNYILTAILIKYAYSLNLIDNPDQRKMHTKSMPVVGGLSIFITMIVSSIVVLYYNIPQSILSDEQIVIVFL